MQRSDFGHGAVIAGLALVGWALCAATMGIGMAVVGLPEALVIHAVAAPIIFAGISVVYFRRFAHAKPLTIAAAFVAIVVFMDVLVVAMLVQRSFAMFTSFLGTWLPFLLIFVSTFLTGAVVRREKRAKEEPSVAAAPPARSHVVRLQAGPGRTAAEDGADPQARQL